MVDWTFRPMSIVVRGRHAHPYLQVGHDRTRPVGLYLSTELPHHPSHRMGRRLRRLQLARRWYELRMQSLPGLRVHGGFRLLVLLVFRHVGGSLRFPFLGCSLMKQYCFLSCLRRGVFFWPHLPTRVLDPRFWPAPPLARGRWTVPTLSFVLSSRSRQTWRPRLRSLVR
jgi:hypothetical protein